MIDVTAGVPDDRAKERDAGSGESRFSESIGASGLTGRPVGLGVLLVDLPVLAVQGREP